MELGNETPEGKSTISRAFSREIARTFETRVFRLVKPNLRAGGDYETKLCSWQKDRDHRRISKTKNERYRVDV